jgi:cobalamin biosynthesis protein CobT
MKLDVFKPCPVQNFAKLIEDQLGVIVRLRGRQINVEYSHPPVIYLPMLENAREEDSSVLNGFCLHEALHLCYSNANVLKEIPNYVVKIIHNAIEDEYIERMGEEDFPDAREHFEFSYQSGFNVVNNKMPALLPIRNVCYLTDNNAVREAMLKLSLDPNDSGMCEILAKRLEIERVCPIWFYEQRGYTYSPHMNECVKAWQNHSWYSIFQKATEEKANNSAKAFEQAMSIYTTLGLEEVFSADERPVELCKSSITNAEVRKDALNEAQDLLEQANDLRDEEIKEACLESMAHEALLACKDSRRVSEKEKKQAEAALNLHRMKRDRIKKAVSRCSERLVRRRKKLREREKALKSLRENSDIPTKVLEEATFQVDNLRTLIAVDENLMSQRENGLSAFQTEEETLLDASLQSKARFLDAVNNEANAQSDYDEECKLLKEEISKKHESVVGPLEKDFEEKQQESDDAESAAREIINQIARHDAEIEAPFAAGALEVIIKEAFAKFKEEEVNAEVGEKVDDSIFSGKAKKYVPFTREFDTVKQIEETTDAIDKYETSMQECRKIVQRTTDVLRRLYSPVRARIKPNCVEGRLDARSAYKVGLALNGISVDVSRVWRQIVTRREPKVAVEIVLDCSGSMNRNTEGKAKQTYLSMARKAATALSAVMSNLNIPHEIVGHTTFSKGVKKMNPDVVKQDDGSVLVTIDGEAAAIQRNDKTKHVGSFSRYVPFKGYVFKPFNEKRRPVAVFSKVEQEDNLDGEAILWAAKRLANRSEKTKILVVISDAQPDALMSNAAELERHLLTVTRQIESKEKDGLHLCALGMDEKVHKFFKNAQVLDSMECLPDAMMKMVENILVHKVGSLA